jgi:hypothetical protein
LKFNRGEEPMSEDAEDTKTVAAAMPERLAKKLAKIAGLSVAETLTRLETISDDEREDNMAFDRAARTAMAFLTIADRAQALLARIDKETAEDGSNERVRRLRPIEADDLEREYLALRDRMAAQQAEADGADNSARLGVRP